MATLSFVIPCYRSEGTLGKVVDEIYERMTEIENDGFEIILVNDCSPDNVWNVIKELSDSKKEITGINLSKNFGQHAALLAGYAACTGDYVVSLDDDGQAPLDSLSELLEKIYEGYDVVYAYYEEIKQNAFRRFGTWMAKKMSEVMLDQPKDLKGGSFYVARKYIIDEMVRYKNAFPYLGGLVLRTTRNITCIKTKHRPRLEGRSGYTFRSLMALWLNGFTAFSVKPLQFSSYLGFIIAALGFIYTIFIVVRRLMGIASVEGWSTIIALLMIIGGTILIMLGLIGEYIGRIYICINESPQYVIKEVVGENKLNEM